MSAVPGNFTESLDQIDDGTTYTPITYTDGGGPNVNSPTYVPPEQTPFTNVTAGPTEGGGPNTESPTYVPTSGNSDSTAEAVAAAAESGAFGIDSLTGKILTGNYGGWTPASDFNASNPAQAKVAQDNYAGEKASSPDLISRMKQFWKEATQFGKDNKDNPLMMMALTGIANHQKSNQAKELAQQQQQYKMDQMDREAQISRDKIAANSASITGMRRAKGIIGGVLTRKGADGKSVPVFNNSGAMQ